MEDKKERHRGGSVGREYSSKAGCLGRDGRTRGKGRGDEQINERKRNKKGRYMERKEEWMDGKDGEIEKTDMREGRMGRQGERLSG